MSTPDTLPSAPREPVDVLEGPVRAVVGPAPEPADDPWGDAGRPLRVLIVDDEADVRLTLRLLLRPDDHFEVVGEAVDGQDALDAARELEPDIVLLDIMMPRLSGREVAPVLFRERPATMVVTLSALDAEREAAPMIALGAFAYLEKTAIGRDLGSALLELHTRFRRGIEGRSVFAPSP